MFFDVFPEPLQLLLVCTQLFGTVDTVKVIVGPFGKALRVLVEGDLPFGQKYDR